MQNPIKSTVKPLPKSLAISGPPHWHFEDQYSGLICGVDEAGRGPLAGPVVCAAVILDRDHFPQGLHDSKKLSPAKRHDLYQALLQSAIIGIGIGEPLEIENNNILATTMRAMRRAVFDLPVRPDVALIDGNRAPDLIDHPQQDPIQIQTIIKGDAQSLSIAAASIIAKTVRDRLMGLAHGRFDQYGFDGHKAYSTKQHRGVLSTIGACPIHRRTFAPVKAVLTPINKTLKNK